MSHTSAQPTPNDRELLLSDPAEFYGKSGNWLSRIIDAILRCLS